MQVIVANLDLDDVTSFRGAIASMQEQMSAAQRKDTVHINFQLCNHQLSCVYNQRPSLPLHAALSLFTSRAQCGAAVCCVCCVLCVLCAVCAVCAVCERRQRRAHPCAPSFGLPACKRRV